MARAQRHEVVELAFTSSRAYQDPSREVQVDVGFSGPGGEWWVPAYWAGGQTWKARFAAPEVGAYRYVTRSSDAANPDLHGRTGALEVGEYEGDNPLYRHGRLRASADRRYLEHADGTPFLWLADTWWMGLCHRLEWPGEFQLLAADRAAKGFSVVQIIAGLYPDMPPFDPRGANEAGYPVSDDYSTINPAYFDLADRRIAHLVDSGLVPCIVACWGYFLPLMGIEKMQVFWRNLVARYGAYPVVWCLAGEGSMPYYLSKTKDADRAAQRRDWTTVAAYVREADPFHNLLTVHQGCPTYGRDDIEDPNLLDFDMLQTGHGGYESVPNTVRRVVEATALSPKLPVLVGEVNYEGILGKSWEDTQRLCFWASVLSGACGHTYAANGIWQVNRRGQPFGPSPHGRSWGDTPWEDAYRLPGSTQLGLAKQYLERLRWWEMAPHQEWVERAAGPTDYFGVYAAGIPGELRVVYTPKAAPPTVTSIEPGVTYRASYFDPRSGEVTELGVVEPAADGRWTAPPSPVFQDMVLVLTRV